MTQARRGFLFPVAGRRAGLATAVLATTVLGGPAAAQQAGAPEPGGHGRTGIEEIVVTASPLRLSRFDVLQGTSALAGEALDKAMGLSIGDTLAGIPGVAQTGYAPGASRPIIRGLGSDRIRVLIDGIGTFDASTASPDHAPAVDVTTARRIEVLRGPATLLYGNNAAGGVVNVLDDRIPTERPAKGYAGDARLFYGSNDRERTGAAGLTAALGSTPLVAHLDGSWRRSSDFQVPGFARSRAVREADPQPVEDEPRGKLEQSSTRSKNYSGGLSYVGEWGFLGASFGQTLTNYGVPVNVEEPGEPPAVRIDLLESRADLTGQLNMPFLIFDSAKLRFGYGDYLHQELDEGEVGTKFLNNQWEGRVELVQRKMGNLSGAIGLQASKRRFRAIGEESFVPPSLTNQIGAFVVERLDFGALSLEGGLRVEHQSLKADDIGYDRDFTGVSASVGASYTLPGGFLIGGSIFRTARAPTAEEVLADGPHAATFSFERGDLSLGKEVASGGELTLKYRGGPVSGSLNGFYTSYDHFVAEQRTGEEEDGLAVVQFTPVKARLLGFEAEIAATVWERGAQSIRIDAQADYVRAQNRDAHQPLPRIPPLRLGAGIDYSLAALNFRAEVQWADAQDRAGPFELPTKGYTTVGASIDWHPLSDRDLTLMLQGRNLTDAEVRYSTSFLKDLLPAQGRTVRIGLRTVF